MLYAVSFMFTECNSLFQDNFKNAMEKFVNEESPDLFENLSNGVIFEKKDIDALEGRFVTAVNTAGVIVVNSDFDLESIAKLIASEDNKTFGEILSESFENLKKDLGIKEN